MKLKVLTTAISAIILSGCSSTIASSPEVLKSSQQYHVLESKKRDYPVHLRNGVVVEQSTVWHLGEGKSFKSNPARFEKPTVKTAWNLPEEEIEKYRKIKSEDINVFVEVYKDKPLNKVQPEKATEKPLVENPSNTENLSQKDFSQIQYSQILPQQHNQVFDFVDTSNKLTDESRERLVHFAPQMLIYNKIAIETHFGKGSSAANAWEQASILKKELVRAGVKKSHIKTAVSKGDPSKGHLVASEKLNVKASSVHFKEHTNLLREDSLKEFLAEVDTVKVEWIRILAGSKSGHPISKALAVKAKLIKHGVSASKITILHRRTPEDNVKSLIYFKN